MSVFLFNLGGDDIEWNPLTQALLVSAAKYKDPNNIIVTPNLVVQPDGEINPRFKQVGTVTDGGGEGGCWRTSILTAANGWRSDGRQKVALRFTPTVLSSIPECIIGMLFCDTNGDPTQATSRVVGCGVKVRAGNTWSSAAMSRTSDSGGTLHVPDANGPIAYGTITPLGPSGDDTHAGATKNAFALSDCFIFNPATGIGGGPVARTDPTAGLNGLYLNVFVGFDSTGVVTVNPGVKIEWAFIESYAPADFT